MEGNDLVVSPLEAEAEAGEHGRSWNDSSTSGCRWSS